MGLLADTAKKTGLDTEKQAADDTLLALAMGCMAFADGAMDQGEVASIEAFASTLPEFANGCFAEPWNASGKIFNKYEGDVKKCVEELKGLSSPVLKQKAFILAVDIALASGDVDSAEDELLDLMKTTLEIDDTFAQHVTSVLASKYAQ
jgi:tellurite resistance protein